MPKAILELEMPESCSNCPLEFSDRMEGFCAITEFVTDLYRDKRRPDCPLKVSEQSDDVKQRLAKGGAAFVVACEKAEMFKGAAPLIREMFSAKEDTCVLCGSYVPEGRMVCSLCEKDPYHVLRKEKDYEKGMKKGKCRGCGAEIVWIKTRSGNIMPCDPGPVPYWQKPKAPGKVVTPNGEVLSCEFEGNLSNATGLGYISHFSTCPKAEYFKKK